MCFMVQGADLLKAEQCSGKELRGKPVDIGEGQKGEILYSSLEKPGF